MDPALSPRRLRELVGRARLNGWDLTIVDNRVTARRYPEGPPVWAAEWEGRRTRFTAFKTRASRAAARRMAAGQPEPARATGATATEVGELVATPCTLRTYGACVCCRSEAPAQARLDLSPVGLCWSCERTHLDHLEQGAFFGELPDPRCAGGDHTPIGGPRTEPFLSQPWRRDPRSRLCGEHDDQWELERWLATQEAPDVMFVPGRGGYCVGVGNYPPTLDPLLDCDKGQYELRRGNQVTRIPEPARHELLALLRGAK